MSKSIKTARYTTPVKDIAELYSHARKALVESYSQIGRNCKSAKGSPVICDIV